jgi:hypothetical protein
LAAKSGQKIPSQIDCRGIEKGATKVPVCEKYRQEKIATNCAKAQKLDFFE